jgi:hypothetical protein
MTDDLGVTHYDQMPLAPIEAHTTYFEAGVLSVGVEYRLLDDAIAAASAKEAAAGNASGASQLEDRGVSLHVYGLGDAGKREHLRFDCFDEDPHYHYVDWETRSNQMIHIDPDAEGDSLAWAIERIRTRLPEMLARAGASDVARALDPALVEAILPAVEEEARRVRLHHDEEAIRRGALGEER